MNRIITPEEFNDTTNVVITNPPIHQPEFPVADLIEENARILAALLADRRVVETYHEGAESVLVYSALHPKLAEINHHSIPQPSKRDALNHGMLVFEAINAAVTTANPDRVTRRSLDLAVNEPDLVESALDPYGREKVSRQFQGDYPWTAYVLHESSKDYFKGMTESVLAGAALEHAITLRALEIEPRIR